jgi:YaiO family outer membrane protein
MDRIVNAESRSSHRGYRGGLIPVHRALNHLELRRRDGLLGVLFVVALVAGWALAWPWVVRAWASIGRFAFEVLGVPAQVPVVTRSFAWGVELDVPRFDVVAALPTTLQWNVGLVVVAVILLGSLFLPNRLLPLAYLLRLLAVVQVSSQIVFALFALAFPYDVGGMTETLMLANLFVIGLVPVIMGFAYNPLAYGWSQRLAASLLPMAHLTVTVPLLYVAHAWILHHGSLLWMPLLFWAFGLVLSVLSIVGFYGWAVSWPHAARGRPRRAPRQPRVLGALALIAVLVPSVAAADDPVESIQLGLDVGRYTEDLGGAESGFVAYTRERSGVDRWRFDLGFASRFDDTGLGVGASYGRWFGANTLVSAGLSTGGGDVVQPDLRFDVGVRRTALLDGRLLVDLGYTHIENKGENSSDGVGAGLLYSLGGGWSVGADGRIDVGQPGDTQGHTVAVSVLYGIYRKLYLSARAETGRVAYLLVGPADALVEFDSQGLRLGATWYVQDDRGVGVEFSVLDTEVYDLTNVGLRAFREW